MMKREFSLVCPAKINLFLEVIERRRDGYHDIESVFLAVDLADRLWARPASDGGIGLECALPGLPRDGGNLVVQAAEMLRQRCGITEGIAFRLEKRIPMGAGLGGGSANAAAALRLADAVWGCGLGEPDFHDLAARLGSDVAFFLQGGLCLCEGRGERVTRLETPVHLPGLGLILPPFASGTASAYQGLRLPPPGRARRAAPFLAALAAGEPGRVAAEAFNRFEETVFAAMPRLRRLRDEAAAIARHGVWLTGSGAGLWYLDEGNGEALRAWGAERGAAVVPVQPFPEAGTFSLTSRPAGQ